MTPIGAKSLLSMEDRAATLNKKMMVGMTAKEILATEDVLYRMKVRLLEIESDLKQKA